jgi:hypothetical protein
MNRAATPEMLLVGDDQGTQRPSLAVRDAGAVPFLRTKEKRQWEGGASRAQVRCGDASGVQWCSGAVVRVGVSPFPAGAEL